ncbi:unnamed protein product [Acanthosepion pharaonis]|uniref:Uncharacterized protein n=1 Tax=Acanthosepion pharaonis TaxID=158019 RepID=A0A812BV34_ACAPH|nr:unnamed protein product [Sepia pharaonis]
MLFRCYSSSFSFSLSIPHFFFFQSLGPTTNVPLPTKCRLLSYLHIIFCQFPFALFYIFSCNTLLRLSYLTFSPCVTASRTLPPGTQRPASPLLQCEVLFFFAHCSHKLSDSLSHIINSLDKNNNIDHYSAHALFSLNNFFLLFAFFYRLYFYNFTLLLFTFLDCCLPPHCVFHHYHLFDISVFFFHIVSIIFFSLFFMNSFLFFSLFFS